MIINELEHKRPVLYEGFGTGGHAFVCDGYQNSDFFHFNWGWDGHYDGYFILADLSPGINDFSQSQGAVIGISTTPIPVLNYDSHQVIEDNAGGGSINGNHVAESGETIELPVTFINSGPGNANDVSAILSTIDTDIKITKSNQNWNSISANSKITSTGFQIQIAENCPEKDVLFSIHMTSDEGDWTMMFTLHVYRKTKIEAVAGALGSLLTLSDKNTINDLFISGTIDARDFKTMRDDMPQLAVLDLSSATIIEYTGMDGTNDGVLEEYSGNAIPNAAFSKTSNGKLSLLSIIFPSSLISIGKVAFQCCSNITSIEFPPSLTTIGACAFNCTGLIGKLVIPASVSGIDYCAFYYCAGLSSIIISSSVKNIGAYAFGGCKALSSIYAENAYPIDLESSVFSEVDYANCVLYVPVAAKTFYASADQWKDFENIVGIQTSSVPHLKFDQDVSLCPNPVSDVFSVDGIEGTALLCITDIKGRVILARQVTAKENVSLDKMPKGVYLLTIKDTTGMHRMKLIKK